MIKYQDCKSFDEKVKFFSNKNKKYLGEVRNLASKKQKEST